MKKWKFDYISYLIGSISMFIVGAIFIILAINDNDIPSCQEDEIIIGTGDYSDGHWDSYTCSHPDILGDE